MEKSRKDSSGKKLLGDFLKEGQEFRSKAIATLFFDITIRRVIGAIQRRTNFQCSSETPVFFFFFRLISE